MTRDRRRVGPDISGTTWQPWARVVRGTTMARTIDQQLAALRAVRVDTPKGLEALQSALRADRTGAGIVVAAAATLITAHRLGALAPGPRRPPGRSAALADV